MAQWNSESNVADVLSLGPRTAGRLMRVGVRSVADLLAAKPQAVARRIGDEKISAEIVTAWQREAQLVLMAPKLPPQATQFFADLGFRNLERIARSTPTELLAIYETHRQEFSGSDSLSMHPDVAELTVWIRCAEQALADRAA